jgi:hypothetical protein
MTTHYFSSLGGTGMDTTEMTPEHVMPNLCFLNPVGSGHIVHSVASGA